MASFIGGLFLAYLLSISFTDEIRQNYSSVSKLVDYSYDFGFGTLIPGMRYNTSIRASWAIPDSALAGLEGKSVAIKVTASSEQNSSVYFATQDNGQAKEAFAYLMCDVQNGTCANTSVLTAEIPAYILAKENENASLKISLKSEIVDYQQAGAGGEFDIFGSLRNIFQPNGSENKSDEKQNGGNDFLNFTGNLSDGNFLDTLKPNGDAHDPIAFLRQNTLISIGALVIVIVITGAYLLNTKD